MKSTIILYFIFFGICQKIFAQQCLSDTTFMALVVAQNPILNQLSLFQNINKAEILKAKGGFDPKLYGNIEQKQFNGSQYYSESEYGLKIPTQYGVEFKAAYEQSSGIYLNPENKTPKAGQPIVGIKIPILQGLFFDERRAEMLKSRLMAESNNSERQIVLNDFFLESLSAYWKWQFAYAQKQITETSLNAAQKRFEATKKLFFLGDRMAMDTLESFIQVQDRALLDNASAQELKVNALKLNSFIFDSLNLNYNNTNYFTPQIIDQLNTSANNIQVFNKNHPVINQYNIKLQQLAVDLRLKKEKQKPKLDFNYNFIGDGFNFPNLLTDNYKWGIQFSTSSLFRSERAEIQLTKIKLENAQLQLKQKKFDLETKWLVSLTEYENLQQQLVLTSDIAKNYERLLDLETKRFNLGESSFFLINARELKLLETKVKMTKLASEVQVAKVRIINAQGILNNFFNN